MILLDNKNSVFTSERALAEHPDFVKQELKSTFMLDVLVQDVILKVCGRSFVLARAGTILPTRLNLLLEFNEDDTEDTVWYVTQGNSIVYLKVDNFECTNGTLRVNLVSDLTKDLHGSTISVFDCCTGFSENAQIYLSYKLFIANNTLLSNKVQDYLELEEISEFIDTVSPENSANSFMKLSGRFSDTHDYKKEYSESLAKMTITSTALNSIVELFNRKQYLKDNPIFMNQVGDMCNELYTIMKNYILNEKVYYSSDEF